MSRATHLGNLQQSTMEERFLGNDLISLKELMKSTPTKANGAEKKKPKGRPHTQQRKNTHKSPANSTETSTFTFSNAERAQS